MNLFERNLSALKEPTFWCCVLATPLTYIAYKGMAPLIVLVAVAIFFMRGWRSIINDVQVYWVLVIFGISVPVSILLAGTLTDTFMPNMRRAVQICALLIGLFVIGLASMNTDVTNLCQRARGVLVALLATSFFFVLARYVLVPELSVDWWYVSANGRLANEAPYSTILAIVCVPAVVLIWRYLSPPWAGLAFAVITFQIWQVNTLASEVAFIVGIVAFAIALQSPKVVVWCFAATALVFCAIVLFGCEVQSIVIELLRASLSDKYFNNDVSIIHRVYIYDFVNRAICTAPWFGIGAESILTYPGHDEFLTDIQRYMLPRHPHNGWLHIWVAGGIFAWLAVVSLTTVGMVFIARWKADVWLRAALMGGLSAWVVVQQVSYSVWASWWIASLSVVLCITLYASGHESDCNE